MLLNQEKTMILLKKYSMNFPKTQIIANKKDLSKVDTYPAVLKIDSPEVLHKTDFGLVYTNLHNRREVEEKYSEALVVLKTKKVKNYCFVVQEQVKGTEIIIGMKRDPVFGSIILFGLGGIFVEVLKDISIRVVPLRRKDCLEMISEIKGNLLLSGYRGYPKVDEEKIVNLLLKTSKLAHQEKEVIEIDFNPVMVNNKKAIVVDARVIMKNA